MGGLMGINPEHTLVPQDALTKTIPIWAAVINQAVARVRLADQQAMASCHDSTREASSPSLRDQPSLRTWLGERGGDQGSLPACSDPTDYLLDLGGQRQGCMKEEGCRPSVVSSLRGPQPGYQQPHGHRHEAPVRRSPSLSGLSVPLVPVPEKDAHNRSHSWADVGCYSSGSSCDGGLAVPGLRSISSISCNEYSSSSEAQSGPMLEEALQQHPGSEDRSSSGSSCGSGPEWGDELHSPWASTQYAAGVAAPPPTSGGPAGRQCGGHGCVDGQGQGLGGGMHEAAWDCSVHLPLWISQNERTQIEERLDGWVDQLFLMGVDMRSLAKVRHRTLGGGQGGGVGWGVECGWVRFLVQSCGMCVHVPQG